MAALHGLVAQTTTLVDLNAMEKDAPDFNVLQLNGTEHVKSMDLEAKKLGPVSAAVIAACIQRNRVLESLKCAAALPCRVFAFPSAPIDTATLSPPPTLPMLCSIRWNEIGDKSASALAAILKETMISNLECAATR